MRRERHHNGRRRSSSFRLLLVFCAFCCIAVLFVHPSFLTSPPVNQHTPPRHFHSESVPKQPAHKAPRAASFKPPPVSQNPAFPHPPEEINFRPVLVNLTHVAVPNSSPEASAAGIPSQGVAEAQSDISLTHPDHPSHPQQPPPISHDANQTEGGDVRDQGNGGVAPGEGGGDELSDEVGEDEELISEAREAEREQYMQRLRHEAPSDFAEVGGAEYFIRIADGEFMNGCNRFYMSGWNQWEVVEAAAGAPYLSGASITPGKTGPEMIRSMLNMAREYGFNVMRIWAHSVSQEFSLQPQPGVYNEEVFRGLDYVLDESRRRKIRVFLSFTDNWSLSGGVDDYIKWVPGASHHRDFFSNPEIKKLYRNHIRRVIHRVNTINGRVYKDDPTIMAWNLINEPRCVGCPQDLQHWVDEMAQYVKSLDSNHLLTVGTDGFYSTSRKMFANPQGSGSWAEKEGQDFVHNHKSKSLDFMSFHSWVDNWGDPTEHFQRTWIKEHVADARKRGLPVILQEFGKIVENNGPTPRERIQFFHIVYSEVKRQMREGPLKGAMFWQWYDLGQVAPHEEGGGSGLYGIVETDEVFRLIRDFSSFIREKNSKPVTGCRLPPAPKLPSVNECKNSWVKYKPGTGKEGPDCKTDINECVRGTAGCHENAGCINTDGSYRCECYFGYFGDGVKECLPVPALDRVKSRYRSDGSARIACDEGTDVRYPEGAPGFAYDPIGSSETSKDMKGGFGSRVPVTIEDCQIACEMTNGECGSFSYNPSLKQCFLKKGASKETCRGKETLCKELKTEESYSCGYWQTYYRLEGVKRKSENRSDVET